MQTLNVGKDNQVYVFGKTLTLTKHGDTIRNSISQNLDERTTSVTVMVIFFQSVILKVLDDSYFQSYFSQLRGILTTTIERHHAVQNFTDMNKHR